MGLYGTETKLEPRHDFTKPGMSEETRKKLKKLTSSQAFAKRVAKANEKAWKSVKHRVWRSRAKKWNSYYGHATENASFTFYEAFADPAEIAKKMTKLQKLGLDGSQVEVTCCPGDKPHRNLTCKACREARKASAEETT